MSEKNLSEIIKWQMNKENNIPDFVPADGLILLFWDFSW